MPTLEYARHWAKLLPDSVYPKMLEAYEYKQMLNKCTRSELSAKWKEAGLKGISGWNRHGIVDRLVAYKYGEGIAREVDNW